MGVMKQFLSVFLLCCCISTSATEKPNFLIILADDLGFSDLACYGGEIKTPVLDTLCQNGLQYTQFYNTARCWPTRSAIMTGYYPQQIGRDSVMDISGGGGGKRPQWAPLFSTHLKAAGYRTYHSGKWHIDGEPLQNGFDRSYHLKDQHRFFDPTMHYEDDKKLPRPKREDGFYGTVEVSNRMISYLKSHQIEQSKKPFFAYLAFAAPHFPLHALPEDIAKVGDRYKLGWDIIRQQRWQKMQELGIISGKISAVEREVGPPYVFKDAYEKLGPGEVIRPLAWNSLTDIQKKFQQNKMTIHAAMVERMDYEIGRVIKQLKDMKAFENTVILFLSDNGASAEIMVRGDGHDPKAAPGSADSHLCLGPGWSNVCNTPFRRHKTWVHEGGSSTPFILHWPAGIKAKGEQRRQSAHVIDIAPTLLDIAVVSETASKPVKFPGESLKSTFTDNTEKPRTLWWAHEGHQAIRIGDWKLVLAKGQKWELFNLKEDRTETSDLASSHPEKVKEMEKQWLHMVKSFKEFAPKVTKKRKRKKK